MYWYNNSCPPFFRNVPINPTNIVCKKLFGACLYNLLLIPSEPEDFLGFSVFIVVSNSSIVIKSMPMDKPSNRII
jgi:hypothetical protein